MAAAILPALGRDTAGTSLFSLALDLARTQAGQLRDNPARVAPPEYSERPAFEDLPRRRQLDIAETVCRREAYARALGDALPESDGYGAFLKLTIDPCVSDSEIGRTARELILAFLADVAAARGDDLAQVAA